MTTTTNLSSQTATREIAECGCTWVYVEETDDRFITGVETCKRHAR